MTTTDNNLTESKSTATSESQEDDEPMTTIAENPLATKFAASKHDDDDDWGEFAEDDDEQEQTKKDNTKVEDEKPKYTFGASSGFGTKGWAATHQTIPTPSKQPTFGGFGSSSGFGGFKSSSNDSLLEKKESTSVPSFGSFAKATASPFAAAAAAGNALLSSSSTSIHADSPNSSNSNNDTTTNNITTAAVEFVGKSKQESNVSESDSEDFNNNNKETPAFGEGAKVKVPGVVQTKVKTGEEDEDTIYQTKAKLLVLDTASSAWKERGVGTFRINMKEEETKKVLQTRLVMRTDSVYRVILNLLLFEGMKVFIMQDKFVRFAGFETETKEDGTTETRLTSFALRCSNPSIAKEVCEQIISCIPLSHDDNDTKA